jgi:hypothetical protein
MRTHASATSTLQSIQVAILLWVKLGTQLVMNAKMLVKLVAFGGMITLAGALLRGHDVLTAIALTLLFLFVVAKVVFALIVSRTKPWRKGGGGSSPPLEPALVPIPRPPRAPPAVCYQSFE